MSKKVKTPKQNRVGEQKSPVNIIFMVICLIVLVFYVLSIIFSFGWGLMNTFKDKIDYLFPDGIHPSFDCRYIMVPYYVDKIKKCCR